MNAEQLRKLHTEHQRRNARFSGMRREDVPPVVRYINMNVPYSFIGYTLLTPDIVDDTVEREILYFKKLKHAFEWKVYNYDTPPDLLTRLDGHGFEIGDEEAVLVMALEALPAAFHSPVQADVRQITDPQTAAAVLDAVQATVFGPTDWVDASVTANLQNVPDLIEFYAAYDGDQPVSAAWIQYTEQNPFAGLYGGATLPAYRGRGFYRALVVRRAQAARARGVKFLTVDASPHSRPILEKLGFTYIASAWEANYTASLVTSPPQPQT